MVGRESSPVTSQSEKKRLEYIYREYPPDTDEAKISEMCVLFCKYCGEYVLILRKSDFLSTRYVAHALDTYPIRKRDMSRVIEVRCVIFSIF